MRRLAIIGATAGLLATAQWGPTLSPSAVGSPAAVAAASSGDTTLDRARASVPLPRTVAMAPPPTKANAASRRVEARPSRSARSAPPDSADQSTWVALARCESGGDPTARSANGLYSGAFQFSRATWNSLGLPGTADEHPYEVQLAAAKRLQARSGWGQWPRCSRRLGLR